MLYKQFLTALTLGVCLTSGVAAQNEDAFRGGRGGQGFGQGQAGGKKGGNGAGAAGATPAAAATNTGVAPAAASATGAAAKAGGNNAGNAGGNAGNLELNPAAVQTGSQSDGQAASGAAAGQAASATDAANFINFCNGKTLTNGLQVQGGSCNGIVMGDIPAKANMVSTVITFPQNGQDLAEGQTFNLKANIANLAAGSFTNPDVTYYAAPQQLNGGKVVGHTHFTVQDMGSSLNPATALDATKFAFFKGVNDDGDGQGNLQAVVTGGLPAGNYRVCTMSSSSNHQPVLMPVAQRGAQDDCTKFTVGQGNAAGGNAGGSAGNGTDTGAASATTGAGAAASSAAAAKGAAGNAGKGGKGQGAKKGAGAGAGAGTGAAGNKRSRFGRFRG